MKKFYLFLFILFPLLVYGQDGTKKTFTVNGVSFNMIFIEGGTFTMGATAEQVNPFEWEKPTHQVTLSSFLIGETEVTQELWEAVMGSNPSYHKNRKECPVENVSWNDCQLFINKLNQLTGKRFRLPTEAEWEYAARGGNKSNHTQYAGSEDPNFVAWHNWQPETIFHTVIKTAKHEPNEIGLYDMSGNVFEWCYDYFGLYSPSAQTNPLGPSSGDKRVIRGGAFNSKAIYCRVAFRIEFDPSDKTSNIGLRLVEDNRVVYDAVDQNPSFSGGQSALSKYLAKNVRYPASAAENGIQGRVKVEFVVEKDGSISEVKVVQKVEPSLDKEAERVIKAMPKWNPGKLKGLPVCTRCSLPVIFKVQSNTSDIDGKKISYTVNGVSFNMIQVGGGTFKMGATSEQTNPRSDELPLHEVTLSSYMIGETEVTQELWQAVMGKNPSFFKGDKRPVEEVTWKECQKFIKKLNKMLNENFRLPTEAEWEFAARGGNRTRFYRYAGSDNINVVSWNQDNSGGQTHNVATKAPNELGLYDMTGNVFEWCNDWYGSYNSSKQKNPQGPPSGKCRILRGDAWNGIPGFSHISCRDDCQPSYCDHTRGLRLAR